MYLIEPFLNIFYRKTMASVLDFEDAGNFAVPPKAADDRDDYLLYIHIPFCSSLCPYCSFHRCVYDEKTARSYFEALGVELRMYHEAGYDFKGMYVGGGTPTIHMEGLLETIRLARELFSIREISVETNPDHLLEKHLALLKDSGVNRLSVGIQSFDDTVLKHIGRFEKYGSGAEIREKLKNAIGIFDTLNLDLIFNMPVQSEAGLRRDLDIIEQLLPEQVTFYPLMTAASVATVLQKSLGRIDYRKEKMFYFIILERMQKNYTGSTAWCFSRQSSMIDEYIIAYDKYVGVGSGAFGYFNDAIYINTFSLDEYIGRIRKREFPVGRVKKFSRKEKMRYFLLMKLFGISMDKGLMSTPDGLDYRKGLWLELLLLKFSRSITEDERCLELTDRGRYYWVMAMREFFIAVDTMRDHCRELVDKKSPSN